MSLSQEKQGVSAVHLHGAEPNSRVLLPFPPVSAKAVTISTQHSRLEGRGHPGTWSQVQGILPGVSPGPSSRLQIKPVLLLLYTWLHLLKFSSLFFFCHTNDGESFGKGGTKLHPLPRGHCSASSVLRGLGPLSTAEASHPRRCVQTF